MAVTGGVVRWRVEADLGEFNRGLTQASNQARDLGKALDQATKSGSKNPFSGYSEGARSLAAAVSNVSNDFGRLRAAGADVLSPFVQATNLALNSVTALSSGIAALITSQARSGIEGAEFVAKSNASFISLTGSIDNANNAMAQAFKFYKGMNENSVGSVFSRFPTISAVNSILKYGGALGEVTKQLELMGRVSIASGVGLDEIAELFGRATAQKTFGLFEYDQLVQRVPALNKELAKQMKVGAGDVREALNGQRTDTKLLIAAFEAVAANGGAAMEKFTATLEYQSGRAKGRIADIGAALVGYSVSADKGFVASEKGIYKSVVRLNKIFADTLAGSTATGQRMQQVLGRLGEAIAPFIDRFADALPSIINGVLSVIDRFAGGLEELSQKALSSGFDLKSLIPIFFVLGTQILGFVGSITGGAGGLLGALGGVGQAVGGVSLPVILLAATFLKALASSEELRGAVGDLMTALGGLASSLGKAFIELAGSKGVTTILTGMVRALTWLADTVASFPTPVLQAIIGVLVGAAVVKKLYSFGTAAVGAAAGLGKLAGAITSFGKAGAVAGAAGAAKGGGGIAATVQTMSQGMTKAQSAMVTMRAGMVNLMLLAAAIAALGYSLKVAHDAIPEDLGSLVAKLGVMASVALGMTLVAAVGQKAQVGYKSMGTLILAAGTIAALATALGYANEKVPPDILGFGAKIANMTIAVGSIVGLAHLANTLKGKIITGLGTLVVVAGALAVAALAVGYANNTLPGDLGGLAIKLGGMVIAIGGMGALAAAIGALMATGIGAVLLGAGLVAILGILGGLAAAAKAIAFVYNVVPDNLAEVKAKINILTDVISHMAKTSIGGLLENAVKALNVGLVTTIVGNYQQMAIKLMIIQTIPLNKEAILAKITLLSQIIEEVSAQKSDSIMALALSAAKNFVKNVQLSTVSSIVDTYHSIATKLNEIQTIQLFPENIKGKITVISGIVKDLSASGDSSPMAGLTGLINTFLKSQTVQQVGAIVTTYHSIATKLNEIQNVQLNKEAINAALAKITGVVKSLAVGGEQNSWSQLGEMVNTFLKARTTESVASIVNTYASMIENFKKLSFDWSKEAQGAEANVRNIASIVQVIVNQQGTGGLWNTLKSLATGGMITEEEIAKSQSILNKFTEIARTLNGMVSMDVEHNKAKITGVATIVKEIGNVPLIAGMGEKELMVGYSQSILNKFTGFAWTVNSFPAVDGGKITAIQSTRHLVWEVSQVNTGVGDMAQKEWVVGMAQSMLNKFTEFAHTLNQLPQVNPIIAQTLNNIRNALNQVVTTSIQAAASNIDAAHDVGMRLGAKFHQGIVAQQYLAQQAGWTLQSSFWRAIENKMGDHYWQGFTLAGKITEGIRAREGDMWNSGARIGNKFKQGVEAVKGYWQSGYNAISGFIGGVESRNAYSVGWWVAEKFLRGLRARAGEHSPWKTTFQSGNFAVQGLADGVRNSESEVTRAANSLVDNVTDILSMNNVSITPSLDVTPGLAPSVMSTNEAYGNATHGRAVVVNQTNNNYTQYSVDQMVRDLRWELRKA